ncbi:type IV pilus biogenesis protein PilP [Kosakonia radicincitans]|uniref:Type IV pilus biogenesis protein PilP n=1 Tax=Kosakonia radicincitans TaxID=283686 RepID=A0AAX2EZI7_9ENTR|nr:type IV pilus biogenesis protein PilP [Kosakonia radicincitans]SFF37760.1 type IV pilus biogenesis protein PilP [Kosakonia radicincitans]SFR26180.1 type IV pilus biogenesis protein PilP [Kosakonia radicincitans]SFU16667.1 type IV pilus biogenesis protein PilP [Kosakonia radicincitans]SFY31851.1 type IV pilus biogenesis protein PilP [Kosakonia radicincitans]
MENVKYAALMLLVCGLAHAEADVRTVGDLDRLQSGRVFYDAQAAYNKAKMAAGQADAAAAPVTTTAGPGGSSGSLVTATPVSNLPTLEKVAGSVATLSFTDGSSTQVRQGDSVNGGYTVVSVSMRGVVIKRVLDGHVFTLN